MDCPKCGRVNSQAASLDGEESAVSYRYRCECGHEFFDREKIQELIDKVRGPTPTFGWREAVRMLPAFGMGQQYFNGARWTDIVLVGATLFVIVEGGLWVYRRLRRSEDKR